MPSPENALRGAGKYFGAKVYANFVPHWEKETRWYFTGMGSRWKEASAYAANEKWDMAEDRWSGFTGVRKTGKAGRRRPLIWPYAMR